MTELSALSRSVAGRTALITGCASGMGRATAKLFAAEGANVAATDINADGVRTTVAEIQAAGREATAWTLDVGDGDAIRRVVGEVAERYGGLDILVNNAGISRGGPIDAD
ncbi:MAG: SDR family NAD(P)-dependent oxidoreductase, partial [Acidobacteriota bacterium]|nr:SDR family NAD(P)-dependent oxidoreductase [Acidobacteriota bacterium]